MQTPLVSLREITKSFSGVAALKDVSLELFPGDILGLIGENGAGKSTLINLLSGVHQPDQGELCWQGEAVSLSSPRMALDVGIATIHQELEGFPRLSVGENMLMGDEWPRNGWRGVDWNQLHSASNQQLSNFGLDIESTQQFDELTPAQRKEVAIASALARDARLLILDEPTASLSEPEVKRLFEHLRRVQKQGVTIVYVSHRLDEILEITSRVAVLRDGQLVSSHGKPADSTTFKPIDVPVERLIEDMVGRPIDQVYPRTRENSKAASEAPLLELSNVTKEGMFHDISLSVNAAEVVGLAGLVGAGRSELARAIFGLYGIDSGTIKVRGQNWSPKQPSEALNHGMVYLPEERKKQGLVLDHSLDESISIGFTDLMSRFGLVSAKKEVSATETILNDYDIRAQGLKQPVGTLSGGNQQKALLARWLERDPEIIILDEPTRGVDIGAKSQIHATVNRLAQAGKGILLISSDLPEVIGMSDRIFVMNRGAISTELTGNNMTEENVVLAASGLMAAC